MCVFTVLLINYAGGMDILYILLSSEIGDSVQVKGESNNKKNISLWMYMQYAKINYIILWCILWLKLRLLLSINCCFLRYSVLKMNSDLQLSSLTYSIMNSDWWTLMNSDELWLTASCIEFNTIYYNKCVDDMNLRKCSLICSIQKQQRQPGHFLLRFKVCTHSLLNANFFEVRM